MYTITQKFQHSFREKGSKFIGYLLPVSSKEHFKNQLKTIQSKYTDASHHCFAWRINPNNITEFSQDDGEPGGTAGPPILNKLKSYKVINCGCIVVRYYGGTNLGISGLIEAYGKSAELCLEKALLKRVIPTQNYEITYPYNQQKEIDRLKNKLDLKEIDAQYTEKVSLIMACRAEQAHAFEKALQKLEHKGLSITNRGSGFITLSTKQGE